MKKILIDKTKAIKEIGRGGFGIVYLVKGEGNKIFLAKWKSVSKKMQSMKIKRLLHSQVENISKNFPVAAIIGYSLGQIFTMYSFIITYTFVLLILIHNEF